MSEQKAKRNSFFFFSNPIKSDASKATTKLGSLEPVNKYPLKHSKAETQQNKMANSQQSPAVTSTEPGIVKTPARCDTKPSSEGQKFVPTLQTQPSTRRRPPPPQTQDYQIQKPEAPLQKQPSFQKDDSNDNYEHNDKGHRRNKSELDQLMEELDHFEVEQQRDVQSVNAQNSNSSLGNYYGRDAPFDGEDDEPGSPSTHIRALNLTQSRSSLDLHGTSINYDSPPAKVRSLKLSNSHVSSGTFDSSSTSAEFVDSKRSQNDTKGDDLVDDQFSFADSRTSPMRSTQLLPYEEENGLRQDRDTYENHGTLMGDSRSGGPQQSTNTFGYHEAIIDASHPEDQTNPYSCMVSEANDSIFDDLQSLPEKPRQLRVVNEHKPNFVMNDESSTTEDESISLSTEEMHAVPSGVANTASFIPELQKAQVSASPTLTANTYKPTSIGVTSSESTPHLESQKSPNESIFTIESSPNKEMSPSSSRVSKRNGTEKPVRLVSSYVEELRLKYFPTSNSLQPPPDLPAFLKTKNNLEQPQNIKVRIRTSSKQIGIKHGKAKQKLLSLETAKEEEEEEKDGEGLAYKDVANGEEITTSAMADHTREFRDLLGKSNGRSRNSNRNYNSNEFPDDNSDESYLQTIPGNEAYNCDDIMAPLREKQDPSRGIRFGEDPRGFGHGDESKGRVERSDTVTSYFTRKANRPRTGTLDMNYDYVPPLAHSENSTTNVPSGANEITSEEASSDDGLSIQRSNSPYYNPPYNGGLHITNQDPTDI